MKTAKEKLVTRLLEASDDIFTEFVIVGLEDSLETICNEIERLLKIKNLNDTQWQDLTELCYDGEATVRVLRYYTAYEYTPETIIINKGTDKGKEWI
jgi:DNA-binding SARP family transcriptional activator